MPTPLPVYADVRQLLGTAWLTPAVAGTPDVNVKTKLSTVALSTQEKTDAQVAAQAALTASGITTANGVTKIAGHTLADAGTGGQGIGAA